MALLANSNVLKRQISRMLCVFLLPSLVASQSYGNMTYNKLSYLMTFHDEEFDVDTSDPQNDYIKSVLILPIIVTVILFLGMLIFQLALLFRCCCKCMRCMSHGDLPNRESVGSVTLWTEQVTKKKVNLTRSFYFLIVLCCILTQGIIWSMQHFSEGSDNAIQATSDLKDISISLENSGIALDTQGDLILNLTVLATPSCPEASAVQSYAEDFETYVDAYMDVIGPIPDNLQDMEDFLNDWAVADASVTGYVFNVYLLFIAMTLPMLISFIIKSKCVMRGSLCCGLIYIHGLLVMFCLYFIALSIMGDYCQAPTDNLISLAPDSVAKDATYYGTCNGTNPFTEPVDDAYEAVQLLEQSVITLTETGGVCEGNAYLLACFPVIADMYEEIDNIEAEMSCGPLQKLWGDIVNDATCHNIYTGLFILSWSVFFIFLAYFCLLIVSSLIYQYFGDLWKTEESLKLLVDVNSRSNDVTSSGESSAEMVNRESDTRLPWQQRSSEETGNVYASTGTSAGTGPGPDVTGTGTGAGAVAAGAINFDDVETGGDKS